MNKPKLITIEPEEVPEVLALQEAIENLNNWKKTYQGAYDEFIELGIQYNTALEAADKVMRAREASSGPIEMLGYSASFNANALYDAVGREDFLKLGGSVQTIQQYDIDKKQFEGYVVQNKVPKAVVEKVVTYTPRFKVLKKVSVP